MENLTVKDLQQMLDSRDDKLLKAIEKLSEKQDDYIEQVIQGVERTAQLRRDVNENTASIKKISDDVSENKGNIRRIEEWRVALDKVIWEILKPPLKVIGVAFLLIIGIVAVIIYLQ